MTERPPRVSVVVPVFDPGPYIEPAIRSILGQTMPAGAVEAIFVDDGSTDGTQDRLDRLAAEHPATIRVIHIAPSGAPGRPRNTGLDAATGDYVQFLDADDELALDAFEHLVPMADRNGSDVVVEKFASASIPRSQRLFDRSIERTTLAQLPTLVDSSLGPAKLYRRTFLLENDIRFPEGWRQMEDQSFTIHAYARARSISVAADRPWYFYNRREDDGHLTSERIDPDRHFRNLRTVLDLVEAETEPGALRDRIVRRMVRVEVLNRVSEPVYPELPEVDRARLFAGARDIVRERVSPTVIEGFGAVRRERCELLRDDRPAELLAMARQLADVGLSATVTGVDWTAGVLDLTVDAGLMVESSGASVRIDDGKGGDGPAAAQASDRPYVVAGDPSLTRIQLVLRSRPSVLDWYVKAPGEPYADRVGASVHARIDPMHVGAASAAMAQGSWDVLVRLSGLGIERSGALHLHPANAQGAVRPALLGDPARVVVPVADGDRLVLEVDPPATVLAGALAGWPIRVIRDGVPTCHRSADGIRAGDRDRRGGTGPRRARWRPDRAGPARAATRRGRPRIDSRQPGRSGPRPVSGRTAARRRDRSGGRAARRRDRRERATPVRRPRASVDTGPRPDRRALDHRPNDDRGQADRPPDAATPQALIGFQARRRGFRASRRYQSLAVSAARRPNVCLTQIIPNRR